MSRRKKASVAARREWLLRVARSMGRFALGFAVGGGVVWAVPQAVVGVRDHPYFAVSQIVLRGDRDVPREALLRAANLHVGMSIWRVSADNARENIKMLARVQHASVRREFPNRVVVTISEREPAAIAVVEGLQFVDRTGRILGPVPPGAAGSFPFVTGITGAHIEGAGVPALRRALRLVRLCEQRDCAGGVSEVHLDPTRGLVLVPRTPPVPILMGWGGWNEKLDRMERVLTAWQGQESRLATVDVTLRRSVVVKLREEQRPTRPSASARGVRI